MSTISETIRKQAEAVKNNSNNAKAAELLIQAAKLLQGETPAPFKFKQQARARALSGRERFANAMSKNTEDKNQKQLMDGAHTDLTAAGWKPAPGSATADGKKAAYVHPSLPGHTVQIDGDSFTVNKGQSAIIPKTHLSKLKNVLPAVDPAKGVSAPVSTQPFKYQR